MLSDYEVQRQARIAANKARMESLGVREAASAMQAQLAPKRVHMNREPRKKRDFSERPLVSRRSARVAGNPAAVYNERDLARVGLLEDESSSKNDRRLLKENIELEVYGIEHLEALGKSTQPWELFQDGYDKDGNRIYDKVSGQTCHQCRQKTLGLRTACSCCNSLQGVFCGDCLFMRYGEHVEEARADPSWRCPSCRGLCNCSFHRLRRGWAPTGTLYRRAIAEGFASVAHYLVLNNLHPEARRAALPLMPTELANRTLAALEATEKDGATNSAEEGEGERRASTSAAALDSHALELDELQASVHGAESEAAQRAADAQEASTSPASASKKMTATTSEANKLTGRRQTRLSTAALGGVTKPGRTAAGLAVKSTKRGSVTAQALANAVACAGVTASDGQPLRRGLRSRAVRAA